MAVTLGTGAVAAGVKDEVFVSAGFAPVALAAQGLGATGHEVLEGAAMTG
jgi:hypothetical protein